MWRSNSNKKILAFISIVFLFFGCDKQVQAEKKLNGIWEIENYQFTNPNGLTYYYDATGTITYNSTSKTTGTIAVSYNYVADGQSYTVEETGSYNFAYGDTEFYDYFRTKNGVNDTIKNARVIILTKTDLRTEMTETTGRRIFVLKKD